MLSTPPAFILSQDRTLKKILRASLALITLIKTQFLELKKVRFTSSFAFYSIFKIRAFPLIFEHIYIVPPSKCSIILIRRAYSVKDFFSVFWTFFLHDLKVYAYYFKYCTLLSVKSRAISNRKFPQWLYTLHLNNLCLIPGSYPCMNPAWPVISFTAGSHIFAINKDPYQHTGPSDGSVSGHVNNYMYRY